MAGSHDIPGPRLDPGATLRASDAGRPAFGTLLAIVGDRVLRHALAAEADPGIGRDWT